MHLPQYMSYWLTGQPVSDYTSLGCHTALWDYAAHDYHTWGYTEGLDHVLPPIVPTNTHRLTQVMGREVQVGVGVHDSSAALVPYLRMEKDPSSVDL